MCVILVFFLFWYHISPEILLTLTLFFCKIKYLSNHFYIDHFLKFTLNSYLKTDIDIKIYIVNSVIIVIIFSSNVLILLLFVQTIIIRIVVLSRSFGSIS